MTWHPPCPQCGSALRVVPLVNGRILCLVCDLTYERETDATD